MPDTAPPLIDIAALSKSSGGVRALCDVSLALRAGEVHALVGENGAGKSTLINILAGVVGADRGSVRIAGHALRPGSVRDSERHGIAVIHQESTAFPDLDAEDNLFVGREPRRCLGLLLDRPRMRRETAALLARLHEPFLPGRPLGELPLAARQLVAIARALSARSRLIIMDEPTASLSAREAATLIEIVAQLRRDGISVLYVSHRLDEILGLADRVTVLRDGRLVATRDAARLSTDELIRLMVGRAVDEGAGGAAPGARGAELLRVQGLTRTGAFRDISFSVHAGEIVGLAGLVGAGRSEVARAICGIDPYHGGSVQLAGTPLPMGAVRTAIRAGLALVPEDRQLEGLALAMTVGENLVLPMAGRLARWGLRSRAREARCADAQLAGLAVKAASSALPARALSGGNQQKLVLGKWLAASPRVLILDEPTRGVDVGARAEIYQQLRALARQGMAILAISSDLPEILNLSDRVLVMRQGELSGELARSAATQERILSLAMPREAVVSR
jgi:ABC-type sugar transport system ATPase subunit